MTVKSFEQEIEEEVAAVGRKKGKEEFPFHYSQNLSEKVVVVIAVIVVAIF